MTNGNIVIYETDFIVSLYAFNQNHRPLKQVYRRSKRGKVNDEEEINHTQLVVEDEGNDQKRGNN